MVADYLKLEIIFRISEKSVATHRSKYGDLAKGSLEEKAIASVIPTQLCIPQVKPVQSNRHLFFQNFANLSFHSLDDWDSEL